VELRGQLSNHEARDKVDLVDDLVTRPTQAQLASHAALRDARQPCIRDAVDVDELASQFTAGAMIKDLAARYAISESTVKRLLRGCGARRR
jgi:hypothetical protein